MMISFIALRFINFFFLSSFFLDDDPRPPLVVRSSIISSLGLLPAWLILWSYFVISSPFVVKILHFMLVVMLLSLSV